MEKMRKSKISFDYSWVIVGLCFVVIFTSLGLCSSGRNLYLTAITDALGFPRSAFSLSSTLRYIATTVVSIFFGKIVSKFGTKLMLCAGFVLLICFAILNSIADSLWVFYIAGVILGVGLAFTGTTMISFIINRWVTSNKATVTSIALAANGVGGAIAVQIISPIIFEEGNPFGFRTSYRLVAAILAVTLLLIIIFYREPKTDGAPVVYKKKRKARGESWLGFEFSDISRKPYFYVLLICVFLTGMTLQGLGGIGIPHMYDIGFDVEFVAALTSISGVMLTFTKLFTGVAYDKLGIKFTLVIAIASAFLSVGLLAFLTNTAFGRILAIIRAVIANFATPLETVMLPIYAMHFFGSKAFDKVIGLVSAFNTAGFAIGAPFGNLCYDVLGSYRVAFFVLAAIMLAVAVGLLYVYSASKKDKERLIASLNCDNGAVCAE